jgi:hypothetical protein
MGTCVANKLHEIRTLGLRPTFHAYMVLAMLSAVYSLGSSTIDCSRPRNSVPHQRVTTYTSIVPRPSACLSMRLAVMKRLAQVRDRCELVFGDFQYEEPSFPTAPFRSVQPTFCLYLISSFHIQPPVRISTHSKPTVHTPTLTHTLRPHFNGAVCNLTTQPAPPLLDVTRLLCCISTCRHAFCMRTTLPFHV